MQVSQKVPTVLGLGLFVCLSLGVARTTMAVHVGYFGVISSGFSAGLSGGRSSGSLIERPLRHSRRFLPLRIGVSWQLSRARFLSSGATSFTESFREVWILRIGPGEQLSLSSPRAQVPVVGSMKWFEARQTPPSLTLTDSDLGRLLGIAVPPRDEIEFGDLPRVVMLSLVNQERGGESFTLRVSDDELYSAQVEVGEVVKEM